MDVRKVGWSTRLRQLETILVGDACSGRSQSKPGLTHTMAAPCTHEAVTLRLLLVRHGLSSFNVERRIQGRDDLSTLTETGEDQARRTGTALADELTRFVEAHVLDREGRSPTEISEETHRALRALGYAD